MHLKISSAKWQPFCLSLNVLRNIITYIPWVNMSAWLNPMEAVSILMTPFMWSSYHIKKKTWTICTILSCMFYDRLGISFSHDDIIKWKHFPYNWPFVRGINWSPVNSSHKGQWRRALVFSLIYAWANRWANNGDTIDLRCHSTHYDISVMKSPHTF